MNTNYKLYLYKPAATESDFLGELLADNVNAEIKLHDISTISFTLPESINGVANPRTDEVLDSYVVELRYGKDILSESSYTSGDYSKIRFTIYNTPLEFSDNKRTFSYTGYSLESLLEFKHITNWGGVEVKDFFRTVKYNNNGTSSAFTEPGHSYSISTSTNPAATKFITVNPTTATATPLDIFIYEVRKDTSAPLNTKEVPYVRFSGSSVNDTNFREGYYFLEVGQDGNVDSIKIAVPGNFNLFNGLPSTKELSFKIYDNPLSRHFAIGINRNTEVPFTDMYIQLAHDSALGDDTPEYGDYTFSSQSIYSKNGLKLEQVLLGKTDIENSVNENPTLDGLLFSTQFTIGYIDPVIAAMYRSNLEFNNITRYQAIKELAESFDAIVVYDTVERKVSFYPQDNTLTTVWPNNGLIIKYGTYLKSITKEIDASKIITSAKALGKNNLGIELITPDANNAWEDFSYYLDDYYVEYNRDNLLGMSYNANNGVAFTSFPTGTSSRWMESAEALKIAQWQYARDYFHDILLGNLDPTISQHDRYFDLYNKRSKAINEFVAAESEFIAWRAEQLKYKYLYDYYYNLKQNGSATAEDLSRLDYYEDFWLGTETYIGAQAAIEVEELKLENQRKDIEDKNVENSIADKLSEVRAFLSKTAWDINLTKLEPFIRQSVMSDNKHDNDFDLLEATITHVNENKVPKVTLKTNIVSIISAEEAYEDWNKLQTGDLINIYFDEFNIDLVAQIKEININFEEHTVDLTISTVHNYNMGYGKYVAKTIRRLYNSDTNVTKHLEDANRISSEQTRETYEQLTDGTIRADNANISFGSTDNLGNQTTVFSATGANSFVISGVDPVLEIVTFSANRGVSIADGTITAYLNRGEGSNTTEVEISGAYGFAIRNTDNDTGDITTVAYIDQEDGSAYFAGWKLEPGQFSGGNETSFVGINSEDPEEDGTDNKSYAFWAGDETASSAPFSVTKDGDIKATSGTIAGLNVGTGYISNANKTAETNPKNAIFKRAAGGAGVWGENETAFYLDEDGRFSLSNELTWNPLTNTFFVNGTIEATFGEIGGWTVGEEKLHAGSTTTYVELNADADSSYAIFAGDATAASAPFSVTKSGELVATNATITGAITATSGSFTGSITSETGKIGGWEIGEDSLTSGDITLSSAENAAQISIGENIVLNNDGSATIGVLEIGIDGSVSTDTFEIDDEGNATFSGALEAATGSFGDTTINGNSTLRIGTYVANTSGDIKIDNTNGIVARNNLNETTFSVSTSGSLTAVDANITGAITSSSGTIGGWNIGANSLTGGNATLASSGNLTLGTSDDVVRLSADDETYRLWAGNATAGSAPFSVDKEGNLVATAATITGAITATSGSFTGSITSSSGTIGGWNIGTNTLTSVDNESDLIPNIQLDRSGKILVAGSGFTGENMEGARIIIDEDGITGNNGTNETFKLTTDGTLTSAAIKLDSGDYSIRIGDIINDEALQSVTGNYGLVVQNSEAIVNPNNIPYQVVVSEEGFFITTVSATNAADKALAVQYDYDRIWAKRMVISDILPDGTPGSEDQALLNASTLIGRLTSTENGVRVVQSYEEGSVDKYNIIKMSTEGFAIYQNEESISTPLNPPTFQVLTDGSISATSLKISGDSRLGGWTVGNTYFESNNYEYTSGNFSDEGIKFNNNGSIIGKQFAIDSNGNAFFGGTLSAGITALFDPAGSAAAIKTELQSQIDGAIDTWFYNYVPTLSNEPASSWTTNEIKDQHRGDIFYNNSTGLAYRFSFNDPVYEWVLIDDSAVTAALTAASTAQTTADGKMTYYTASSSATLDSALSLTIPKDGDILIPSVTFIHETPDPELTYVLNTVYVYSELDGYFKPEEKADGSIAGWTINATDIKANNDRMVLHSDSNNNGVAPYISIAQSSIGYENEGIFLGRVLHSEDPDVYYPKLSLVNSEETNYLKWTGLELQVKGNVDATSGTIGGFTIANDRIKAGTLTGVNVGIGPNMATGVSFYAGAAITSPATEPTNDEINAAPFRVTNTGALTATSADITGAIKASSGEIGSGANNKWIIGTDITDASIYNGKTTLEDSTNAGIYIGTDGISLGTAGLVPEFSVTSAGVLNATSATITGTITATDGSIGSTTDGWDINANILESKNDYIKLDAANNKILVGNITLQGAASEGDSYIGLGKTGYALSGTAGIYAGLDDGVAKLSIGNTTNSLTWDGEDLSVTGQITATSGAIAGFTIEDTVLTAGSLSAGASGFNVGLTPDSGDSNISIWAGASIDDGTVPTDAEIILAPFTVSKTGALKATDATINGEVNATSGSFSGVNIDGTLAIGASGSISIDGGVIVIDSTGIRSTNEAFKLETDDTGKIGGFLFDTETLTAGNITLDATSGSEEININDNIVLNGDGSATIGVLDIATDGTISTSTGSFEIDGTTGDATFAGEITAESGTIGSYTIDEYSINKNLISKATFESASADYNGWVLSGTWERSDLKSYAGSHSVRRVMNTSTSSSITYTFTKPKTSNVQLRFAYQFADYSSSSVSFFVQKNGNSPVSIIVGNSVAVNTWNIFNATILHSGSDINTIRISTSSGTGPSPTLFIDEIELFDGSSVPLDFINLSSAGLYLPDVSLDKYGIIANAGKVGPLLLNNQSFSDETITTGFTESGADLNFSSQIVTAFNQISEFRTYTFTTTQKFNQVNFTFTATSSNTNDTAVYFQIASVIGGVTKFFQGSNTYSGANLTGTPITVSINVDIASNNIRIYAVLVNGGASSVTVTENFTFTNLKISKPVFDLNDKAFIYNDGSIAGDDLYLSQVSIVGRSIELDDVTQPFRIKTNELYFGSSDRGFRFNNTGFSTTSSIFSTTETNRTYVFAPNLSSLGSVTRTSPGNSTLTASTGNYSTYDWLYLQINRANIQKSGIFFRISDIGGIEDGPWLTLLTTQNTNSTSVNQVSIKRGSTSGTGNTFSLRYAGQSTSHTFTLFRVKNVF